MFPELNNILDISPESPPKGKSYLVTESRADSTFVLHHFLSLYIRSGFNVCLVGLAQAYNHYKNVATKLRVDLNKAKESGQFVFIEGLKAIGGNLIDDCQKKPANTTRADSLHLLYTDQESTLKPLFDVIKSSIHSFSTTDTTLSSPTLVILDDISVLWSLGSSPKDVLSCVQYVQGLMCGDGEGCLLTCMHVDTDAEDDDGELILKYLIHQSDCVIVTRGLKSGYSKDVHGEPCQCPVPATVYVHLDMYNWSDLGQDPVGTSQVQGAMEALNEYLHFYNGLNGMSLRWKNISQSNPTPDRLSSMQFKITDRNVNFFALGTSAAVL